VGMILLACAVDLGFDPHAGRLPHMTYLAVGKVPPSMPAH
jgi:hypothetical protein